MQVNGDSLLDSQGTLVCEVLRGLVHFGSRKKTMENEKSPTRRSGAAYCRQVFSVLELYSLQGVL